MAHIYYVKNMRILDDDDYKPSRDNYKYIGEVEHEDLDLIFRAMNAVDGSPIDKHLAEFKCRSMSVGDIVVCNHGTFLCDRVGWKDLWLDKSNQDFYLSIGPEECRNCTEDVFDNSGYCEDCDLKECSFGCGQTVNKSAKRSMCHSCYQDGAADHAMDMAKDARQERD